MSNLSDPTGPPKDKLLTQAEQKINAGLRERSGSVRFTGKLTSFLYDLLRDHLPAGKVEQLVREAEPHDFVDYSNGWLAQYAEDVAKRLGQGYIAGRPAEDFLAQAEKRFKKQQVAITALKAHITKLCNSLATFSRASGDCICEACELKYYDHPEIAEGCFHVLCDGSVVKL